MRFSPDGRVFVAEKSGIIKVFDRSTTPTPRSSPTSGPRCTTTGTVALLNMELAPNFPTDPVVYVGTPTTRRSAGWRRRGASPCETSDGCPRDQGRRPTGASSADGSHDPRRPVTSPLEPSRCCSRTGASRSEALAHRRAGLRPDGALYVTGGDGANTFDYGAKGIPTNPCGDPPSGVGGVQAPPPPRGAHCRPRTCRPRGTRSGLKRCPAADRSRNTGNGPPDNPYALEPRRQRRGGSWATASATRSACRAARDA